MNNHYIISTEKVKPPVVFTQQGAIFDFIEIG